MAMDTIYADMKAETLNQSLISAKKVEKWKKFGLLEGLNKRSQISMARLLENQAQQMLTEASTDSSIKGFQAIAFPLVRRVFGQLLTQEICSVQPMALPAGLLFYLDFTFGTTKAGVGSDDWFSGKSLYGNPVAPLTSGADAAGGHYNLHNSYTQFEASGSLNIGSSASVTLWSEVDYDPELSQSVAQSQLFKVTVDLDDASATSVDETAFKMFAISGTSNSLVTSYYRRFNTYDATTKVLTVYYSGSQRLNSGSAMLAAWVKKDALSADTTGSQLLPAWEFGFNATDQIPEVNINVSSIPVQTNSRKLKVKWTPEIAQDMNAYHTVDVESELTQIMADQVALDIDSEMIRYMVNSATAAKFYWDRRPGFFVDRTTGAPVAGPTFTGNTVEWYLTLLETIRDVSNTIHRKTLRAGANFMVTSPDVCTILESLVQWRPSLDFEDRKVTKFSMGVEKVGTLQNVITVYKAPFMLRNVALIGYKGDNWLETGMVYAPYVPLIVTPTIYQPDNFVPTKGVMTRYAKQVVRGDYYGLCVIKGMGIF